MENISILSGKDCLTEKNMRYSVLVHSCDKYREAWVPFFALYNKYWQKRNCETYLSCENLYPEIEGGIKVIQTGNGSWSSRLHNAISKIDSDFIVLFLEDFFFQKAVEIEKFNETMNWMVKNSNLGVIYYNRITGFSSVSQEYPGYYEMNASKSTRYMLNCQASLWRKELLLAATEKEMSPQEFEDYGYTYLNDYYKQMIYLCSINTRYDAVRQGDIFSYVLNREQGYGIWSSKWLWNNKKLFKKEGISFHPTELPVMSRGEYYMQKLRDRLKSMGGGT